MCTNFRVTPTRSAWTATGESCGSNTPPPHARAQLPVCMTDPGASDLAHAAQPCVHVPSSRRLYVGQCKAGGRLAFFVFMPSAGATLFGRWGTLDMRALNLRCLKARTNLLHAQAGLPLVPAEASELLAFAGDRSPFTLIRALEMQALPAAQAVSHYRASLAKSPSTHGVDTPEYLAWYKACPQTHGKTSAKYQADIKRGAQTKAVNLAQSQRITLEEAQSLLAQHPACPCLTCGHTAFRPESMKVNLAAINPSHQQFLCAHPSAARSQIQKHLLRTHRPLERTALHIPPDGAVTLRNFKVVHRVPTNTWSVIR
ncbi:hypothetical protein T492DRAFT_1036298 [Pavlovales sp. CCMP2436]|nr:hypothetical protein T492DRAFT_1036298 [Pavlovales sp. CCMP2436]